MPYTKKAENFFRAVAHGFKPTGKQKGSKLTPKKARSLLRHGGGY